MLYLIDANVLITANRDYYPCDRLPQFWAWLLDVCEQGHAKMPYEVFSEIHAQDGPFKDWLDDDQVQTALILAEEPNMDLVDRVFCDAYAPDLTDTELDLIGQDAMLIAYALAGEARTVVTKETSKPTATRANTKVPDACGKVRLRSIDDFAFYRELNFNTLGA